MASVYKGDNVPSSRHIQSPARVHSWASRVWTRLPSHAPTGQDASVSWSVSMTVQGPDGGIILAGKPGLETQISYSRVNSVSWIGLLVIMPLTASISLPSLAALKGGGRMLSPPLEKLGNGRESTDMLSNC